MYDTFLPSKRFTGQVEGRVFVNRLTIDFENCYGIKRLKREFDFGRDNAIIIYAPNGTMKTSFAKSFSDLSEGKLPRDRLNDNAETRCIVIKSCKTQLEQTEIIALSSEEDSNKDSMLPSSRDSVLVADSALRQEYTRVTADFSVAKEELIKTLASSMGYARGSTQDRVFDLETDFGGTDFHDIALQMMDALSNSTENVEVVSKYKHFPNYKTLFKDNNIADVATIDQSLLDDYMKQYDQLLEKCAFLHKGTFNHYNLEQVGQSLHKECFFEANHIMTLVPKDGMDAKPRTFQGKGAYDEVITAIAEEQRQIQESEELQKQLDKIDKELNKNQRNRTIREILNSHPNIVEELRCIASFKKNIWLTIFNDARAELENYTCVHSHLKEEMAHIVEKAGEQRTTWEEIIDVFNARFDLPFKVSIRNKPDAILRQDAPKLEFEHVDSVGEMVDERKLINTLSRGEKRAVYFLDILYALAVDEQTDDSGKRLLIIDDIADSFDYRNKHAIIHYLSEWRDTNRYKMILLTHNFDFYRSVASRLGIKRSNVYMVNKAESEIKFYKGEYLKNVFSGWLDQLHTNRTIMVAAIPFARNLVEYFEPNRDESENYGKLTSMLHIKSQTHSLTIADLETIFRDVLRINEGLPEPGEKVLDVIYEQADTISNSDEHDAVKLENKVVLAMASRLKAEEYMLHNIPTSQLPDLDHNCRYQTRVLFECYREQCSPKEEDTLMIIDEVNIITPESIHLNSFMYEPLIDMGIHRLRRLYQNLCDLVEC